MFNYHRFKYLCLTDTSLNNINIYTNVNLLYDNNEYNRNNNVGNRTESNINNSSTNNIIDYYNNKNLEINNRINYNNYVDNEIYNEYNNTT